MESALRVDQEFLVRELLKMHAPMAKIKSMASRKLGGSSQNELARLYFALGNTRARMTELFSALEDLHARIEYSLYVPPEDRE